MRMVGRALQKMRATVKAEESVCWLCGDLIDGTLGPNDPGAFELDHVIPASLGGGHHRGNLRASHRLCNQRRSNRPATRREPPRSRQWL